MTTPLLERPPLQETVAPPSQETESAAPSPPAWRIVVASALSGAGAAWMAARLFHGTLPIVAAMAGVAIAAAALFASLKSRRPGIVQLAALPAALIAGTLLAASAAGGAAADVPRLVQEAFASGGLRQAPIAFDPGWRLILLVLCAAATAGAGSTALSLARPRLAVALPLPLLAGAAMLQPQGAAGLSGGVAIAVVLAALSVAYGGELSAGAETGRGFERRRLLRGVLALVALVGGMVLLGRASFLFPDTARSRIVPPQKPTQPLPQPDRVLFRVESARPGPWRVGVLDVYDGSAWLLPPFDEERFAPVRQGAPIGGAQLRDTETTTITIAGLDGHLLPAPAGALIIDGVGERLQIDPRTGTLRIPDARVKPGLRYRVEHPLPPTGRQLSDAAAPPAAMQAFLRVPTPPNEVTVLLDQAPENLWDRLQFVRSRFYQNIIAAGKGTPIDVPPHRVAQMIKGGEATPWEITAAEAILARWAGVPSRIGFGFYRGQRQEGAQQIDVRPKHGATWLEVYFEGHGWVPVVGVPPRARSSLDPGNRNDNPNVQPSDELGLVVHVPIRLTTVRLLYTVVRYWAGVTLPWIGGGVLLWLVAPAVAKSLRGMRRRRFAERGGLVARIGVAYAELRDTAIDFGAAGASATPVAFTGILAPDEEHEELAWLVTRVLWGDLRRDVQEADADAAQAMASSVRRRLMSAQTIPARIAAKISRASLRAPYTADVPNLWPARRRRRRMTAVAAALLVLTACGTTARTPTDEATVPAMPSTLAGFIFQREPIAEAAYARAGSASLVGDDGLVYTLRRDDTVEAYLQVARFKDGVSALDRRVRDGVLSSIGSGSFKRQRLGTERIWTQTLPEQRMHLWFTPGGSTMLLLVARRSFDQSADAFGSILRFVKGIESSPRPINAEYDPRRGFEP